MSEGRIRLTSIPGGVRAQIVGRLADEHFRLYRDVMTRHAGTFEVAEDGRPATLLPEATVIDAAGALRRAGLYVEMAPSLAATLRAKAAAARTATAAADERIIKLRADMKERGEAPWAFQETGVIFLAERPGALLADEPGLGKSPQALWATDDGAPTIIVCKASLVDNWLKHSERWRPDLRPTCGKLLVPLRAGEVRIMTFGQLPEVTPEVAPGTVLIADEAHELRNPRTNQHRRFAAIASKVRAAGGKVWLLTGTPLMNKLDDLWNVLDSAGMAEELFGTKKRFRQLATTDRDEFGRIFRRVTLRRTKKECYPYMPSVTRENHYVKIGPNERAELDAALAEMLERAAVAARERYRQECRIAHVDPLDAEADARAEAARHNVTAAIDLAFAGDQAIPFDLISRVKTILCLAKMKHTAQLVRDLAPALDAAGTCDARPILVFSEHLAPVHEIADSVPGAERITGDVDGQRRQEIVELFNALKVPVLSMTGKTGGVGFDLPAAAMGVWNDLPWNEALVSQAEDRMRRPGQEAETITAVRVVADHVLDERILELITEKQRLSEQTVGRATITPDARPENVAALLEAVLDAMPLADSPSRTVLERRAPATRTERDVSELLKEKGPTATGVAKPLAEEFNQHGGLTGPQWTTATRWAMEHHGYQPAFITQGARPAKTASEVVVAAGLRALRDRADTLRAHDRGLVADLAKRLERRGLDEGEWVLAAAVIRKYDLPPGAAVANGTTSRK